MSSVLDNLSGRSAGRLFGYAVLVSLVVIVVRIVWVFVLTYLPRRMSRRLRERDPLPPWGHTTLVAWSAMRGSVSLAAALAVPLQTDSGAPFPERDLVIFLAFAVILATLVGQGLTLPALIRALKIEEDTADQDEEMAARVEIAFAAVDRIDELAQEEWVNPDTVERTRGLFEYRRRRFSSQLGDGGEHHDPEDEFDYESRAQSYQEFMGLVIAAQRQSLRALRDDGQITDEVRRRVEYDLDLEEARIAS